ncbi:MAG: CDP-glucose 4,6-dehydratase [Deltaproteobacteria bacterium]|nr:MAG: CDP-glucose 4,6-dehydratase [Deltaproteobacteria bacterium]
MFDNIYNGRRVLVTGHTGFKGSWLTTWLVKLGAKVIGVSKDIPTQPSMFEVLNLSSQIQHIQADIRDLAEVKKIIDNVQPEFVFHLAAQAIVSVSYNNPVETIMTNVLGTLNILESLRTLKEQCVTVLITSDKCYDNVEWVWGYRETDQLGGKDVYSGSKASAELVIKCYLHSFFQNEHPVRLAIGRAGNVIGGGDWARDRIIADCMRAWSTNNSVEIRSPQSTRPWQHVLEPLSGYLLLGQALEQSPRLHGEAFNFGPRTEQNHTVLELLNELGKNWMHKNNTNIYRITGDIPFHESSLLKLNCDKSLFHLKWESNLDYSETVKLVGDWYDAYYRKKTDMYALTLEQINIYERLGIERDRIWSKSS